MAGTDARIVEDIMQVFPIDGINGVEHDRDTMADSSQTNSVPGIKTLRMRIAGRIMGDRFAIVSAAVINAIQQDYETNLGGSRFYDEESGDVDYPIVTEIQGSAGKGPLFDVRFSTFVQAAHFRFMKPIVLQAATDRASEITLVIFKIGEIFARGRVTITFTPAIWPGEDIDDVTDQSFHDAIFLFLKQNSHIHGFAAHQSANKFWNGRVQVLPMVHLIIEHDTDFHSSSLPGYVNDYGLNKAHGIEDHLPNDLYWFKLSYGFRDAWCPNCKTQVHPYETCKYTVCEHCHQSGHLLNVCTTLGNKRRGYDNRR